MLRPSAAAKVTGEIKIGKGFQDKSKRSLGLLSPVSTGRQRLVSTAAGGRVQA